MRSEAETSRAMELYGDMVRRICLVHLKNEADSQDVFQNVFLKYLLHSPDFENSEHEKAWFIRVAVNACKDLRKAWFFRRTVPLEELSEQAAAETGDRPVLEAVLCLPAKYKDVIYLHYYEGYTAAEIGKILKKNPNTVYTLLTRGRELLRKSLGGEDFA